MRHVPLAAALLGCGPSEPASVETADPYALAQVRSVGCGGAYATVQSAIDAAGPGDVVEVCPGTWSERLTIAGKRLTLRSTAGAAATTIDAQTWGRTLRISAGADVVVEGLTFANGRGTDGGNLSCDDSTLELRDSVVVRGQASTGGGLSAGNCQGSAEGTTFEANVATWRGGGAHSNSDSFEFVGDTFVDNVSTADGGGLFQHGGADVEGNTFDSNHAVRGGGGWIDGTYGAVRENVVVDNTSSDDGAGFYALGGGPTFEDNRFVGNDTDDEAGALRIKLSTAVVRANTFEDNHADYRGGAIKVSHEAATLEDNVYRRNSTWVTGGAVLLYESASVLRGETFEDNTAENGGAVAVLEGWADVTFEDCSFDGNVAAEDGGQLYVHLVGHRVVVRRSAVRDGRADDGGAIYAWDSDLRLENSTFTGNEASDTGGALWYDRVTGRVTNSVFFDDVAPTGAALYLQNGLADLRLTNSVFASNTGSAVRVVSGAAPRVRYDTFRDNTSDFSGMSSPLSSGGNLTVDPRFVDAAAGDFRLAAGSALVNAGDPAVLDVDGSRSDQGRYGGPQGW
jgi:hypothetical protein